MASALEKMIEKDIGQAGMVPYSATSVLIETPGVGEGGLH